VKKLTFALPLLFVSSTALAEPTAATLAASPSAPVYEPTEAAPSPLPTPAADEPATLAGSHGYIKHNGWYVAPSFGGTTLDGHYSSLVGLHGSWLINRQFGIGLTANAFGWDRTRIDSPQPNTRVDGGYGGLLLQYIIASDKLVHGTVETTICFRESLQHGSNKLIIPVGKRSTQLGDYVLQLGRHFSSRRGANAVRCQ